MWYGKIKGFAFKINGDFTFDDVSDIWGLSFNGYSNSGGFI